MVGTLFARGRRTATAALRQMSLREAAHFSLYHHVLNRARWSALELNRRLLLQLVRIFVAAGGPHLRRRRNLRAALGALD